MFMEVFYKNKIMTVGHELTKTDIPLFFIKKNNFLKNKQLSIFEEHSSLWKSYSNWTDRKFWNYFCWFINSKNTPKSQILDNQTATIVLWDMLSSYKAWRHCRGYPVNGQRTWSNAKSCSKNNTLLRNFRLQQMQNSFGSRRKANYTTLIQAEANNKLWLRNWPFEWLQGRHHAVRSKSRKGFSIAVDITNLAKAITTGYRRYGTAEKWNKSKKALRTVTVGLPLYFSRFLFGIKKKSFFKFQLTMLQPEKKTEKKKKKKKKR